MPEGTTVCWYECKYDMRLRTRSDIQLLKLWIFSVLTTFGFNSHYTGTRLILKRLRLLSMTPFYSTCKKYCSKIDYIIMSKYFKIRVGVIHRRCVLIEPRRAEIRGESPLRPFCARHPLCDQSSSGNREV